MTNIEALASKQENIVQLLGGVMLSLSNSDAFYFSSNTERDAFFDSKVIYSQNDCMYVREKRGFKFPANKENMRELTYMRFRNADYNGVWVYCYVTDIEYVNPQTTIIHFVLDAWTTYQQDVVIRQCDVVREHTSATAPFNANTVPEGLDIGEYQLAGVNKITLDTNTFILVSSVDLLSDPGTIDDIKISASGGDVFQNIPSAAQVYVIEAGSTDDIGTVMNLMMDYPWISSNIISLSVFPKELLPPYTIRRSEMGFDIGVLGSGAPKSLTKVVTTNWKSIFGGRSEPKLYCYPYCMIEVVMPNGASCVLRPELLEGELLSLYLQGVCIPSSTVSAQCLRYGAKAGVPQDPLYGGVIFSGFPSFPIQSNTYAVSRAQAESSNALALSQQKESDIFNGIFDVMRGGASLYNNDLAGFIASLQPINNRTLDREHTAERNRQSVGQMMGVISQSGGYSQGAQTMLYAYDKFCITTRFWTIKPEYVNRLTQFFNMYGYKVNEIKVPNISLRSRYNYVKCSYVNIYGNIPNEYLEEIRSMFLNGCTFWRDWDGVGNYGNNPNWG